MWGIAPGEAGKPTQIRVMVPGTEDQWAPPEVETCIAGALGGRMIHRNDTAEFTKHLQAELGFSVTLGPNPESPAP